MATLDEDDLLRELSTAATSATSSPTAEQRDFERLPTDTKLSRLDALVQKSQVYLRIIAQNLMENVELKKASSGAASHQAVGQPKLLSGAEMRDYQLEGLDFLVSLYENGLNGILADEMGLGKTIQCIAFVAFLIERGIKGPFLVVVPLSTMGNWRNEFARFAPEIEVLLYMGSKEERQRLRQGKRPQEPQRRGRGRPRGSTAAAGFGTAVVLTLYEISIRDHTHLKHVDWKFLIVDEGHRLKNSKCLLIQKLKELKVQNRLLITGTPLQNNLNELWLLLNFILPDIFHDLELFQQWFNFDELTRLKRAVKDEYHNTLIEMNIQKNLIENLHTILKPFILRRLKKDVIKGLPPKKEYIVYVRLTAAQQRIYRECLSGHLYECLVREYFKDYLKRNFAHPVKAKPALAMLMEGSRQLPKRARTRASRTATEASSPRIAFSDAEVDAYLAGRIEPKPVASKRRRTAKRHNLADAGSDDDFVGEQGAEDDVVVTMAELERRLTDFGHMAHLSSAARTTYVFSNLYDKVTRDLRNRSLQNILMQLRSICNSPYIFYEPFPTLALSATQEAQSDADFMAAFVTNLGKMQVLDQIIGELLPRGHKVLIFSQFTKMLDLLSDWFRHKCINCCRLDGSSSQAERQETIDGFSGVEGAPVFLLSTRAGGLGINLTTADTVILFDSDWNPQIDLQAIDRAHRIGQTKPVKIYRFVVRDSIEEVLLLKSYSKIFLNKLIIQMNEHKTQSIEKILLSDTGASESLKESDDLVKNLKTLIELPKSFSHSFAGTAPIANTLEPRELAELLDRSPKCYADEAPTKFDNITVFETINNMEQ